MADANFGQPVAYVYWPGASSTWPVGRLKEVNEGQVGPPDIPRNNHNGLDFGEDIEYRAALPLKVINDDVTQIQEIPVASTFGWVRIMSIVRSALVCGVLALALASVICLVAGIPIIPGWAQGLSAMGGVAVGAAIGLVRRSVA